MTVVNLGEARKEMVAQFPRSSRKASEEGKRAGRSPRTQWSGSHFVVPSHSNTRWEKIEMQMQIQFDDSLRFQAHILSKNQVLRNQCSPFGAEHLPTNILDHLLDGTQVSRASQKQHSLFHLLIVLSWGDYSNNILLSCIYSQQGP